MANDQESENANFIVGLMKTHRKSVFRLLDVSTIDFDGCSEMYVQEKIEAQIQALKLLRKQVAAVEKRQRKSL